MNVQVPTPATLKKYGLSEAEWCLLLADQDGGCGACGKVPSTGRLYIDHEHLRGWSKMKPEERTKYVRGLLCYMCNKFRLARGATVENLLGAAHYLERYQARKDLMTPPDYFLGKVV